MHPRRPSRTGLTLIELLVVLAVAAILASIAWPAYQNSVSRGRRADAMSALAELSQAQERWRGDNPSYQDTLANLPGVSAVSHGGHYDLSLVGGSVSRTGYTAQATVRSGSPQSTDTACQVLLMQFSNGRFTYSSQASGGSANAAPDPCWVR